MARHRAATIVLAVFFLAHGGASLSPAQNKGEKKAGGNDQVKLYSNAIEVVEVQPVGEKCEKAGTTLRLRVVSESPIDVKVLFQTKRGGWGSSDYANKKKGDEIAVVECQEKAKFKVHTRGAGTEKWATL